MTSTKTRATAVASALLTATWTLGAAAEQPRTAETATPRAVEPAASTGTTPVVSDPLLGVETERRSLPNAPLLVTGTLMLGATYGASVIGAQTSDRDAYDKLYYPVAGPWLALEDRDCSTADPCDNKTLGTTLLVGSGILQGVGALGMLMSLFIPQETTRNWYLVGNEDVVVAPVMNASTVGATAVGRF